MASGSTRARPTSPLSQKDLLDLTAFAQLIRRNLNPQKTAAYLTWVLHNTPGEEDTVYIEFKTTINTIKTPTVYVDDEGYYWVPGPMVVIEHTWTYHCRQLGRFTHVFRDANLV